MTLMRTRKPHIALEEFIFCEFTLAHILCSENRELRRKKGYTFFVSHKQSWGHFPS